MSQPTVSYDEACQLSFLNGWHEAMRKAVDILQYAREGEIDADLRSLISRIESLKPEEQQQ